MSKKRLANKKNCVQTIEENHLKLKDIRPLTYNQRDTFQCFLESEQDLFLHGMAGTGKSYIALYLALKEVERNPEKFRKVIIFRNVVPTRDMGFLPGNSKEKAKEYELPYETITKNLFGRDDAYGLMKTKGIIEFQTTSFIRGMTYDNCIMIADEVQNMTAHELNSLITRRGDNTRVIFAGDLRQNDLTKHREYSGLKDFMTIIQHLSCFDFIEFGVDDIVRSDRVKEYLIIRTKLEDSGLISNLIRD